MSAGAAPQQPSGSGGPRALLALVFGPPIMLAAVRAWLEWLDGRHAPSPAFALAPLPVSSSVWALFLPWLLAALALVVAAGLLWLWWRRGGGVRAVQRVLLALWALLWLGGAGAIFTAHANTEQLAPQPAEARVLGLRPLAPSLRQLGGSEVVLEVSTLVGPQRVRIIDEQAAPWSPGQRLRVGLAHGRFYGLYLTGWDLLEPTPAAQ